MGVPSARTTTVIVFGAWRFHLEVSTKPLVCLSLQTTSERKTPLNVAHNRETLTECLTLVEYEGKKLEREREEIDREREREREEREREREKERRDRQREREKEREKMEKEREREREKERADASVRVQLLGQNFTHQGHNFSKGA